MSRGAQRLKWGLDLKPEGALKPLAVENVLSATANLRRQILLGSKPAAFARNRRGIRKHKLGRGTFSEIFTRVLEWVLLNDRPRPVDSGIGKFLPLGGIVGNPPKHVRHGIGSDLFHGGSSIVLKPIHSHNPLAQEYPIIRGFGLLKGGAESQDVGTNGDCSEEEESLFCVPFEKGGFHIGSLIGTA